MGVMKMHSAQMAVKSHESGEALELVVKVLKNLFKRSSPLHSEECNTQLCTDTMSLEVLIARNIVS